MVKNKESIPISLKKSVDSLPKRGVLCTTFLPGQKASYWLLLVRLKAPILMRVFSKIGRSWDMYTFIGSWRIVLQMLGHIKSYLLIDCVLSALKFCLPLSIYCGHNVICLQVQPQKSGHSWGWNVPLIWVRSNCHLLFFFNEGEGRKNRTSEVSVISLNW